MTAHGYEASFQGGDNVQELHMVMDAQHCEDSK